MSRSGPRVLVSPPRSSLLRSSQNLSISPHYQSVTRLTDPALESSTQTTTTTHASPTAGASTVRLVSFDTPALRRPRSLRSFRFEFSATPASPTLTRDGQSQTWSARLPCSRQTYAFRLTRCYFVASRISASRHVEEPLRNFQSVRSGSTFTPSRAEIERIPAVQAISSIGHGSSTFREGHAFGEW